MSRFNKYFLQPFCKPKKHNFILLFIVSHPVLIFDVPRHAPGVTLNINMINTFPNSNVLKKHTYREYKIVEIQEKPSVLILSIYDNPPWRRGLRRQGKNDMFVIKLLITQWTSHENNDKIPFVKTLDGLLVVWWCRMAF